MISTVQELIDELNKISNKSLPVKVCTEDGDYENIDEILLLGDTILIDSIEE